MKAFFSKRIPLSAYMSAAVIMTWLALVSFLFFVDLPAFKNEQISQVSHQLRHTLQHAQNVIGIDLQKNDLQAIQTKVNILASEHTIETVLVTDPQKNILASSERIGNTHSTCDQLNRMECETFAKALKTHTLLILQQHDYITGFAPIPKNESLGMLIIRVNISHLNEKAQSMLIDHMISHTLLIFLLVLMLVIGGILFVNRPLAKLRNEVEKYQEGKSLTPFTATAPLEITNLARVFETMTINLNTTLAMLQSEKIKFEATFEQAAVGIAHVAPDGSWLRVNQKLCDIVGYSRQELLASTFQDITHPDDLNIDLEYVRQMLSKERTSYTMRKRYLNKEQQIIWVDLTVALVWKSTGEPDFFISVVEDINDQVKAESELRNQEAMMMFQSRLAAMGEMIGMIAHQWRQPLTVISMEANTIILNAMMNHLETDETTQNAHKILGMTQHLSQTIDDFRNFFSPDKQQELSSIGHIIDDAITLIDKSLEHNAIKLIKTIQTDPPIYLYTRELSQVFVNILKNAKDALIDNVGTDRNIWITITQHNNDLVTTISNNGGKIPEDVLPRVFEPYFTTKHPSGGTGLGLYMSKIIVEKHHHGTINVANTSDGCMFTITIPTLQEKA